MSRGRPVTGIGLERHRLNKATEAYLHAGASGEPVALITVAGRFADGATPKANKQTTHLSLTSSPSRILLFLRCPQGLGCPQADKSVGLERVFDIPWCHVFVAFDSG
jgi:hypothetical protein